MPKTSTGNKRTSSASTKKSGLKRRFDLTNRKVQFFVVIAIVAVLGGGYFTVRSFAASEVVGKWTANQMNCAGATGKCTRTNDTSKNNISILRITGTPSSKGGFISATSTQVYQNTDYRICLTVKSAMFAPVSVSIPGTNFRSVVMYGPTGDAYQRACSSVANTGPTGTSYKKIEGVMAGVTDQTTVTNLQNAELEVVYPTPTLPANPTPAK